MQGFFDGFGLITRSVSDGTMRLRVGGDGPPLLLPPECVKIIERRPR